MYYWFRGNSEMTNANIKPAQKSPEAGSQRAVPPDCDIPPKRVMNTWRSEREVGSQPLHCHLGSGEALTEHYDRSTAGECRAFSLIATLEQMHPELRWSPFPMGDYDQYAEADAPDVLVSFSSADQDLDQGLVDPYATVMGELCDPSAWGLSAVAARLVQDHNRVFLAKYPGCNGPRFLLKRANVDIQDRP